MKDDAKVHEQNKKPNVALSTFALYDAAHAILEDTANTFMIMPAGVDAHSYEPTPKQVIKLYKSDLVFYSGAGLEPWIDSFEFKNKAIDMSKKVTLRELNSHEHHNHHTNSHEQSVDPHYWLDLSNMVKIANFMTQEFIKLAPNNEKKYLKNRDLYVQRLKNLDKRYKESLSSCKLDTIVVNHNAFSYLSNKYDFNVEALSGLSPDAQPSAKSMAELIEHVREHKLKTIFFESFVSDKAIKSIANEAKVGVDVLEPLGNITADEWSEKLSYEDIMLSNLEKISKALECR